MTLNENWAFLASNRFYAAVIVSIGYWLQTDDPFTRLGYGKLLVTIGILFIGVKTIDRIVDKFTNVIGISNGN
jgi:hypothetical protein